jgi:hypothetical protein
MPEWPKGRDWKSRECPQGVPRVRIPLSPPPPDRLSVSFPPPTAIHRKVKLSWPVVGIVIRKIECAAGSIFPFVRYRIEWVFYIHLPAHKPIPPVVFRMLPPRFNFVHESVRIIPHSVKSRRIISDEAMVVIRGPTNGEAGQG